MRVIREVLVITLLSALTFSMLVVAFHVRSWTEQVDKLLDQANLAAVQVTSAADTSNLASTQALNLIGSATTLVDHTTRTVDGLKDPLFDTIKTTNDTVKSLQDAIGKTSDAVEDSTDILNTQVNAISTHLVGTLDSAKGTMDAATGTLDTGTSTLSTFNSLLNGPVHTSLLSTDLMLADFQTKSHSWMYPPKQPKIVQAYKFLRSIAPLVQPAYYGFKIYKED